MTTVTPIRQPPIQTLRNALDVCVCYEDTKNVSAESAQQQLPRLRALLNLVIAQLSEPHADTITQMRKALCYFYGMALEDVDMAGTRIPENEITEREARDAAAVILQSAMTWGIGADL